MVNLERMLRQGNVKAYSSRQEFPLERKQKMHEKAFLLHFLLILVLYLFME